MDAFEQALAEAVRRNGFQKLGIKNEHGKDEFVLKWEGIVEILAEMNERIGRECYECKDTLALSETVVVAQE